MENYGTSADSIQKRAVVHLPKDLHLLDDELVEYKKVLVKLKRGKNESNELVDIFITNKRIILYDKFAPLYREILLDKISGVEITREKSALEYAIGLIMAGLFIYFTFGTWAWMIAAFLAGLGAFLIIYEIIRPYILTIYAEGDKIVLELDKKTEAEELYNKIMELRYRPVAQQRQRVILEDHESETRIWANS